MSLIKNYDTLALSPQRKLALSLVETAIASIQPETVLEKSLVRSGDTLTIDAETIDLSVYERVFVIGFGKGSAQISQIVEKKVADKVTGGYVIDTVPQTFSKLHFTLGTHPLPSEENITFTNTVLENIKELTEKDLVLIVICGGGSAMFESPFTLDFPHLKEIFDRMLKSGANISEMNVIRKHLSKVKGGGLAKHLYPARIVSMIFSDVPGNELSTIASGPTVKNEKTMDDAMQILAKYSLDDIASQKEIFTENPQEDKYFSNVSNIIMLSNMTALTAMQIEVQKQGYIARIYSDKIQGDAKEVGKTLLDEAKTGEILLVGGETTVKVKGTGKGGRNQTLVLSALQFLKDATIVVSIDSDGVDFVKNAGALGDKLTIQKAKEKGLNAQKYLENDDSMTFFDEVGDSIFTGPLESNVSDLMMVLKI